MQIDFSDFEPGKPMIIENYGKRVTITVEDLPTEERITRDVFEGMFSGTFTQEATPTPQTDYDRVQEAIKKSYGPFTFSHTFKPNATVTFGATRQKVEQKLTPVATPAEPDLVEYVYWNADDEVEREYGCSDLRYALSVARSDFASWDDRPLEIRVNGEVRYSWRELWRKLTPLPLIGPNDQVAILINPLDK